MATEVSATPSYDYSSIGSMGGEAAQSVNGTMINKISGAFLLACTIFPADTP